MPGPMCFACVRLATAMFDDCNMICNTYRSLLFCCVIFPSSLLSTSAAAATTEDAFLRAATNVFFNIFDISSHTLCTRCCIIGLLCPLHIPGTNGWIVNAPRCATLYNCSFNCTLLVSSSSSNKADTTSRAIPLIDSALMTTHDGNLLDHIMVVICCGCLPLEQDLDRVLLRLFLSVYPDCHQLNMK